MKLPVPKRGITTREFYHQYVPELWLALVGTGTKLPQLTVCVRVKGDAEYGITLGDSGLTTTDGAPEQPLVTFATDMASFRIALLDLLPRVLKHIEPKASRLRVAEHLAKLDTDALRKKPGSITHVYQDDAGDEATVVLTVGNGGRPAASISVTDTELWKILDAGMRLSQLVRSRIKVGGDVAYVLDLARVVEG